MENKTALAGNYYKNSGGATSNKGNYKAGFLAVISEELSANQSKDISNLLHCYAGEDNSYLRVTEPCVFHDTSLTGSGTVASPLVVAGKQATITGAATTITSLDLTASKLMVTDANGKVAVSASTATEAGYLTGVTSAIQTQLGTKEPALSTTQTTVYGLKTIDNTVYTTKSFSVATQMASLASLFLSPDGTKVYGLGGANIGYQYTLSTPWDISTASYATKSYSMNTQDTAVRDFFFSSDGTKMYALGGTNVTVYQYTLGTAWDISTASYASKSYGVTTQDNNIWDIFISPDGTKMYITGLQYKKIFQYTLGTAWDVSTASYASKSYAPQGPNNSGGVWFSTDGYTMYTFNSVTYTLYQYTLTTAYDVSTASYISKSIVLNQDTSPQNNFFYFSGTTAYLYTAGGSNKTIYEYTIPSSGSAIFSQPFQKATYKKAIIYLAALENIASYTFPTAFTYTPQILSQSLAAVATVSTTGVILSGATSTGFIELSGY